jgi:hypothetical protein
MMLPAFTSGRLGRRASPPLLRAEELVYVLDHALGLVEQEQMASSLDDPKACVRHQPRHKPWVREGDDRVIIAGDDQGRLGEPP